jgi:hypothetical protein
MRINIRNLILIILLYTFTLIANEGTKNPDLPSTPELIRIFDNAIINAHPSYEVTVSFKSTDPESDPVYYEVMWDTDPEFLLSPDPVSDTTESFGSGLVATATIPAAAETVYYWQVRATDDIFSGNWSSWSEVRSFTMDMETDDVYWYQVTGPQFEECTLSNITVRNDSVILNEFVDDTLSYWKPDTELFSSYKQFIGVFVDINFCVRFTHLYDDLLRYAFFWFDSIDVAEDIKIIVWDDTNGYPSDTLGNLDIPVEDINLWPDTTKVDLRSLNINVTKLSDFYIGYALNDPADTLSLVYDSAGSAPERSYMYWGGFSWQSFADLPPDWDWLIEAIVGDEEGTLISPDIAFSDLYNEKQRIDWDGVKWRKSNKEDSIGIQIEYKNQGEWELIPDVVIGTTQGYNSVGFFDMDTNICTVDLTNIGNPTGTEYDTLRIRAIFRRPIGKASDNPKLKMWGLGNTDDNITIISDEEINYKFSLNKLEPNPFINKTRVRYQLPRRANVKVQIFDITGREVITLEDGIREKGCYSLEWKGVDKNNNISPAGIYFVKIKAGELEASQKLILVR